MDTVPPTTLVTPVMVRVCPTSLPLLSLSVNAANVISGTTSSSFMAVKISSAATGASFTGVTLTAIVLSADVGLPSPVITVMVSAPL